MPLSAGVAVDASPRARPHRAPSPRVRGGLRNNPRPRRDGHSRGGRRPAFGGRRRAGEGAGGSERCKKRGGCTGGASGGCAGGGGDGGGVSAIEQDVVERSGRDGVVERAGSVPGGAGRAAVRRARSGEDHHGAGPAAADERPAAR